MPKKCCPANKPRLKKGPSTQEQVTKPVSSRKKPRAISVRVKVQGVDVQVKTQIMK